MVVVVGNERRRYVLSDPQALKTETLLSFIHHPLFTEDWAELGMDDDDLAELELCVMLFPKLQPILVGTAGIRIIEVYPEARPYRPPFKALVCYVFFQDQSIAALLAADSVDGDLEITAADREKLRNLMDEIAREI